MTNQLIFIGIVIAAIAIIWWARRGIAHLIYGVLSWIFIIVFVAVGTPVIFNYAYNDEDIYNYVYDNTFPFIDEKTPVIDEEMIELPEKYEQTVALLEALGADMSDVKDNVNQTVIETANHTRDNVVIEISKKATEFIIHAGALVFAFLLANIICLLAKIPLKIVLKFFKISY